ncbi:MAG: tRNA pseudouridine(38-40) synthase TruA [Bacteroidia bacterium]|nr:tRNA pseudouridine(38-40) synthase TruA [Bacteroidia bacterium]NNJ56555.1 tRNA pseudouridine(38-40) synthase TruA [Bacteroidia bacterium]
MRYVLEIAYNGAAYHGWQYQSHSISVQQVIEEQLSRILRKKTSVLGCGRTDAGVHATQFYLHFDYLEQLPERFIFRLNQMLPNDIAIYEAFEVDEKFHARFKATYRKYIYKTAIRKNPFTNNESLHLFKQPDMDLMNKACTELLKHKDFASFCKSGGDNKTTLCDLMEARWETTNDGMEFHVKADRFLRNMVRALVGTLLEVGYGAIDLKELVEIILSKNRSNSGKSVAARGLFLAEVGYNWDEYRK